MGNKYSFNRAEKRRDKKTIKWCEMDLDGAVARNLELTEENERLAKELASYKEECQKLRKNQSFADIDRKEHECGCDNPQPIQNNSSDTKKTHICLTCGGWS